MRTNIDLDPTLVDEAFRYTDATTKKDLVHQALKEFVERHRRRDMRDLRGAITFVDGYDHERLRRGDDET